jgi:hypothetical protein
MCLTLIGQCVCSRVSLSCRKLNHAPTSILEGVSFAVRMRCKSCLHSSHRWSQWSHVGFECSYHSGDEGFCILGRIAVTSTVIQPISGSEIRRVNVTVKICHCSGLNKRCAIEMYRSKFFYVGTNCRRMAVSRLGAFISGERATGA